MFAYLEQKELIPLHIKHQSSALILLPEGAHTVFPKQESSVSRSKAGGKAKPKKHVTIKQEIKVTYHFPEKELMEKFQKGLIAARCPIAVDWSKLTISFANQYESEVKKVIKSLNQDYTIKIEDVA